MRSANVTASSKCATRRGLSRRPLELLRQTGGYCNIDQPRLRNCLGPSTHVFGPTAYVRLHGRNAQNWFAENIQPFERYNYLYAEDELREWVSRLNEIAEQAENVYVFANNHYRGQGVANALEIRSLLESKPVAVPDELVRTYPRLKRIALPPRDPGCLIRPPDCTWSRFQNLSPCQGGG